MRTRTWRWLVVGVAVVGAAATVVVVGVGWYFSGVALAVVRDHVPPTDVRLAAAGAGIVLTADDQARIAGLHAVRHPDGWGIMSEEVAGGSEPVEPGREIVRSWRDVTGELPRTVVAGVVDSDVYLGDPSAVGLAFTEVAVSSEVGDLPTWVVPPTADAPATASSTWVVFAHGRGGTREEALRYLPLWHELGHPVVVPSYRNDPEAPPAPDGRYAMGETEWRDLDTAVAYALDSGAEEVVLAGWSMGGAMALQLLDRSEHVDAVAGVVLNSPVVDWRHTLRYQGSLFGLPAWWSDLAIRLVEARSDGDLDMDRYDWVARARELPDDVPIYLVHSAGDTFVPNDPSVALAEARPDVVTFVDPPGADHTREWNVDPDGYEAAMRDWFETELG